MSVDPYAVCPCGNGKKIKFCKCKDSVGQMDQVLTMIEGGQVVPALDRLKSILDEHPDAAWALAIRGRLLLDLREYQSLEENAERFIRLQPSNPLALTQRAAAMVFAQDMQGATDSILEALNESGQEVDAFVMDVALVVAMGLAQSGIVLSARVFALLASASQGYDNEHARSFLTQLDTSPSINHHLKSIPRLIERPADVAWGERYDEAVSLLKSNKVLLAQDKFESLRRSASEEPAVASGLFHCAVWRGDLDRQAETALQLSQMESLSFEERVRFRTLNGLLAPIGQFSVKAQTVHFEFDNVEEVEVALVASGQLQQLPPEQMQQIQVPEGEVKPRSAFLVADREIPDEDTLVGADAPVCIGLVLVFGRQTDREPQAVAHDLIEDRVAPVREAVEAAIGDARVTLDDPEEIPMMFALEERPVRKGMPKSMAELTKFNREFASTHEGKRASEILIGALGGKSLSDVSGDESLLLERSAVVRALEGQERLLSLGGAIDDVYQASGIDALPEIKPDDETLGEITCADYFRVDPSNLAPPMLLALAMNARSSGAMTSMRRFAETLVEKSTTETAEDSDPRVTLEGYILLMMSTPEPEASIAIGDRAIAFAKANELPYASILLARLELCLSLSDQDGFRQTLMDIESNYGNDPSVMARVQQLLVQLGIIRPDGSLRAGGPAPGGGAAPNEFTPAPPPAERSGGVWTPDQPSEPKPSGGEGGGKLWVPGMD